MRGYAHALGKLVLPLIDNAADIPFDLKQKLHLVYSRGSLAALRKALTAKLFWAKTQLNDGLSPDVRESLDLYLNGVLLSASGSGDSIVTVPVKDTDRSVSVTVVNKSPGLLPTISHAYLLVPDAVKLVPMRPNPNLKGRSVDIGSSMSAFVTSAFNPTEIPIVPFLHEFHEEMRGVVRQYRLPLRMEPLPHGAMESFELRVRLSKVDKSGESSDLMRIDLHTAMKHHSFSVRMELDTVSD